MINNKKNKKMVPLKNHLLYGIGRLGRKVR